MPSRLRDIRASATGTSIQSRVPTIGLGLVLALASWFVVLNDPAPGLDPSWGAGLYMGLHEGVPFGTDIVFTYGPLGFLINSVGWYGGLQSVAFVWLALLHVALAVAIVWALRRSLGLIATTAIAFVILCLLLTVEVAFALAAIACLAALQRDRPRYAVAALVVGGALFAAVELLVKLSVGPPLLVMFALALVGARARPWQIVLYFGLFGASVVALWIATGQSLADLPAYAANGRQIISGYSEAMNVTSGTGTEHLFGVIAALVALGGLIAAAALAPYRDDLARWAGVATVAVAGFVLFKEGVVRYDLPHLAAYFSTIAIIWIAIPWSPSWTLAAAAVTLVLVAGAAIPQLRDDPGGALRRLDPVANVDRAVVETKDLLQPGERRQAAANIAAFLRVGYGVDPAMLAGIEGRTVAIEPWEIATAWAYGFDWSPLPVFQNYSAYTAGLDDLNADRVASAAGPERILRENPAEVLGDFPTRTIDGRYPGWDPPGQALATLCNFRQLQSTSSWQLLGRVPDRCGEPRLIASVESSYGETVEVPRPPRGEVVFARIHGAGVSGLETLRALLYRAKLRYATVNGGETYRLVPGTAADGLLLRGERRITGRGPFAQAPGARTLELTGPDGALRYDFYAMAVGDPAADGSR